MTDRELLQQALAALCQSSDPKHGYRRNELFLQPKPHIELYQEAIEALRARLAQPEPDDGYCTACKSDYCTAKNGCVALDNPPPQREWQGLTDEEIDKICETQVWNARRSYARAIEANLKEKNT